MSALELKQIKAIEDVHRKTEVIEHADLATNPRRISEFSALLYSIQWRRKHSRSAKAVDKQFKKLQREVQEVAENLTRLLFALDAVEAEGDIRLLRKRTVIKIQRLIKVADKQTKRTKDVEQLLLSVAKYCNAIESPSLTPASSSESIHNIIHNSNSSNNILSSSSPSNLPLTVIQRYQHLNLPEWSPTFVQTVDNDGNYIISAALGAGMQLEDIDVTHKGRIVTIEGVKLNSSTPATGAAAARSFLSGLNPFSSSAAARAPYGFFRTRKIVSANADLQAITHSVNQNGVLTIRIPKAVYKAPIISNFSPNITANNTAAAAATTAKSSKIGSTTTPLSRPAVSRGATINSNSKSKLRS